MKASRVKRLFIGVVLILADFGHLLSLSSLFNHTSVCPPFYISLPMSKFSAEKTPLLRHFSRHFGIMWNLLGFVAKSILNSIRICLFPMKCVERIYTHRSYSNTRIVAVKRERFLSLDVKVTGSNSPIAVQLPHLIALYWPRLSFWKMIYTVISLMWKVRINRRDKIRKNVPA